MSESAEVKTNKLKSARNFRSILGEKVGMTQVYGKDGKMYGVSVIKAGPCPVMQVKTESSKDGYNAVQLAFVAPEKERDLRPARAVQGGGSFAKYVREIRPTAGLSQKKTVVVDSAFNPAITWTCAASKERICRRHEAAQFPRYARVARFFRQRARRVPWRLAGPGPVCQGSGWQAT